jgi:membrane peptidoglycan carboxypeptidase
VTVLEHTSAFGVFATKGLRAEATPIEKVQNDAGEILVEHAHPVRAARVLTERAANEMWDMLRYVVTSGTGRNAQIAGEEIIGKTGTTSSQKDVWFMGASHNLVTGVWIGYDRPHRLPGSSGGGWSAPTWQQFMRRAIEIQGNRDPIQKLVEDARVTAQQERIALQNKKQVRVRICRESGLLATSECPDTKIEVFSSASAAPKQRCNIPSHQPNAGARSLGEGNSDGDVATAESDRAAGQESTPDETDGAPARRDFDSDAESAAPDAGADTGDTDDSNRGASLPARRDAARLARRNAETVTDLVSVPVREGDEVAATICADSGLLARRGCPVTLQRFFAAGKVPRRACNLHR